MKKHTLIFIIIILYSRIINAQYSYANDHLTEEESIAANKEIIANSTCIIDGIMIESKMKSLVKQGEIDRAILIRTTNVLRSAHISKGDSIVILIRNVAHGTDELYDNNLHMPVFIMFSENQSDRSLFGEFFLKEFTGKILFESKIWPDKKVFELCPTKYGYASVYFKDWRAPNESNEVFALFGLKFKTKKEWYDYLNQFPNIRTPETN